MNARFSLGLATLAAVALLGCGSAPELYGDGPGPGADEGLDGAGADDGGNDDSQNDDGAEDGPIGNGGLTSDAPGSEEEPAQTRQDECWLVRGNPTCSDVGLGAELLRIDPMAAGTYPAGEGTITVTLSETGAAVDFSSTVGIDGVIVKAGNEALVCKYYPEAYEDSDLIAALDAGADHAHAISHVVFCDLVFTQVDPSADVVE